jgi:hypothetical protein
MDTTQTTEIVKEQKEKVFAGAVGAFLFALAGGVMWYLLYQVGFLAGISGAVAVIAAVRGYTFFAKGRSVKGIVISVVMSVIVLVLAWYLCLTTDIYNAIKEWHAAGDIDYVFSYWAAFQSAYSFLEDKDIAFVYLKDLGLGLFLCIGASMFCVKSMLNEMKKDSRAALEDAEEATEEEATETEEETPAEENE